MYTRSLVHTTLPAKSIFLESKKKRVSVANEFFSKKKEIKMCGS